MKRMLLIGRTGHGKTTLVQAVNRLEAIHRKTQTLEFHPNMVDTPGEYLENRQFYRALIVTSVECDIIALVQSCDAEDCIFPPGFASIFTKPVIGIVTKADSEFCMEDNAVMHLERSGAKEIYITSSVTGEGMEAVRKLLE